MKPRNSRFGSLSRRQMLTTTAALGASLAFPAIGRAATAVPLRVGSDSPLRDEHSLALVKLKEQVEAKTDGRIAVTIFPDGQLGANDAMMNGVKAGTLDGMITDLGVMAPAIPEIDVVALPFLFKNTEHALRALGGAFGDMLKTRIEGAYNCQVLGWGTDGTRNMWNGTRPIHQPDDLKGLKMRTQSSQIQIDTYAALGALPTPVPFTELYTALQTGVVDGADVSTVDMVSLKFYQVTKYLTLTAHVSILDAIVVSDSFMKKISPEDQEIVRAAGAESGRLQADATLKRQLVAIDELKAKKIEVVELPDNTAFVERMSSVYETAVPRIKAEALVEAARKTA